MAMICLGIIQFIKFIILKSSHKYSQLSPKRLPLGHDKAVAYGKDQQNKPNTGLINYLYKNITLADKIRQIETNLFLIFFTSIHSSDETLYNILQQITVKILVYLQI